MLHQLDKEQQQYTNIDFVASLQNQYQNRYQPKRAFYETSQTIKQQEDAIESAMLQLKVDQKHFKHKRLDMQRPETTETITNSTAFLTHNPSGPQMQQSDAQLRVMAGQQQHLTLNISSGQKRGPGTRLMSAKPASHMIAPQPFNRNRIQSAHMRRNLPTKTIIQDGIIIQSDSILKKKSSHENTMTIGRRSNDLGTSSGTGGMNGGAQARSRGLELQEVIENQQKPFLGRARNMSASMSTEHARGKSMHSRAKRIMQAYAVNPISIPISTLNQKVNSDLNMLSDKSRIQQHTSPTNQTRVPLLQLETDQKFDNLVSEITAARNQPTIVSDDILSQNTEIQQPSHNTMIISNSQAQQRKQALSTTPASIFHKNVMLHKPAKTPTVNTTLEAIYQEFTNKKVSQNPKREDTRGDKLMRIYEKKRPLSHFGEPAIAPPLTDAVRRATQTIMTQPTQAESAELTRKKQKSQKSPGVEVRTSQTFSTIEPKPVASITPTLTFVSDITNKVSAAQQQVRKSRYRKQQAGQSYQTAKSALSKTLSKSVMTGAGKSQLGGTGYNAAKQQYLEKLAVIKPGQAIDALKDEIKLNIRSAKEAKDIIEYCIDFTQQVKEKTEYKEYQAKEAQYHTQQIFRDLATFEFNYAKNNSQQMYKSLDSIDDKIKQMNREMDRQLAYSSKCGFRGWMSEDKCVDLKQRFTQLKSLRIQQVEFLSQCENKFSLVKEVQTSSKEEQVLKLKGALKRAMSFNKSSSFLSVDQDAFAKNRRTTIHEMRSKKRKISSPQAQFDGDQQIQAEPQLSKARQLLSQILIYKEHINEQINISGQQCYVEAQILGGEITGFVSSQLSSRQHKFRFKPLQAFGRKIMLFLEVRRLYLEYRLVNEEMDQYKVCIDVVAEEDNPKNDFNLLETRMIYLGEIAGAPQKYVRINLRKLKKHTSPEEKLEIGAYKARTGCLPPINYDTVEFEIVVTPKQEVYLEVELARFEYLRENPDDMFDMVPLNKVAPIILKEIVLVEVNNGQGDYSVHYKKDLPQYQQIEMLNSGTNTAKEMSSASFRASVQTKNLLSSQDDAVNFINRTGENSEVEIKSSSKEPQTVIQSKTVSVRSIEKTDQKNITFGGQANYHDHQNPLHIELYSEDKTTNSKIAITPYMTNLKDSADTIIHDSSLEEKESEVAVEPKISKKEQQDFEEIKQEAKQIEMYDFFYEARKLDGYFPNISQDEVSQGDSPEIGQLEKQQSGVTSYQRKKTAMIRYSHRFSQELYELFDSQQKTYTNGKIQKMIDSRDYVEMEVEYQLELDWTASEAYRINFRPDSNQKLSVLFIRDETKDFVQLLVGKEDQDKSSKDRKMLFEGTDDPDGLSCYKVMIKFDERLIDQYQIKEIRSVESLMDNVPIFCGCHRFRKLMWEEYHNPVPKNERVKNSKQNYGRQYALRNLPQIVIHDALSDDSHDGVKIMSDETLQGSPQSYQEKNLKQVQRALRIFDRKQDAVKQSQNSDKVKRVIKRLERLMSGIRDEIGVVAIKKQEYRQTSPTMKTVKIGCLQKLPSQEVGIPEAKKLVEFETGAYMVSTPNDNFLKKPFIDLNKEPLLTDNVFQEQDDEESLDNPGDFTRLSKKTKDRYVFRGSADFQK